MTAADAAPNRSCCGILWRSCIGRARTMRAAEHKSRRFEAAAVVGLRVASSRRVRPGRRTQGSTVEIASGSVGSFLNCSHVANVAGGAIGAQRGAVLSVTNSTFYDNELDTTVPIEQGVDISAPEGTSIALHNSFSNRGEDSILVPYIGSGNCILDDSPAPVIDDSAGYSKVFLTSEFGCTDVGSNLAARTAAGQTRRFAAELNTTVVGLRRGNWWRPLTSVLPLPWDLGPIDAGRHHRLTR